MKNSLSRLVVALILGFAPVCMVAGCNGNKPTAEEAKLLAPPTEESVLKQIEVAKNEPGISAGERKMNVGNLEKKLAEVRAASKTPAK